MYTGLLLGSFGAALATASPARMAFTALLGVILSAKMETEEAALRVCVGPHTLTRVLTWHTLHF